MFILFYNNIMIGRAQQDEAKSSSSAQGRAEPLTQSKISSVFSIFNSPSSIFNSPSSVTEDL